jgi:flagellar biosynthetic protein FliR
VNTALLNALAPHGWPLFALLTARVLGVVIIAPLWSSANIPPRLRAMLVLAISLALAPGAMGGTVPESTLFLPIAVGAEFLLGLAIGFTATLFLNAVIIAGDVIAVQMGLSIASVYDPTSQAQVTEIGQLTTMTAVTMYAVLGGPLILIGTLHDTMRVIPLGTVGQFDAAARTILPQASILFIAAVRLAAPVMASLFLANVALELGIAHTLGRPVLMVGQDDTVEHLFPSVDKLRLTPYRMGALETTLGGALRDFLAR